MLTFSFTDTEEHWMKNRFDLFQSAYMSVSPSKDLMDDLFKLLQRDDPISCRFIPTWMDMTSERLRRVLKTHPEFNRLPSGLQDAIFKNNFQAATAVAAVQMDHCKSGKDQVKHFIGNLNPQDLSWEEGFRNVIDLDELHCSYLHKPEMNLGKWDNLSLKCYFEISDDIAKMCLTDHIFQLFGAELQRFHGNGRMDLSPTGAMAQKVARKAGFGVGRVPNVPAVILQFQNVYPAPRC